MNLEIILSVKNMVKAGMTGAINDMRATATRGLAGFAGGMGDVMQTARMVSAVGRLREAVGLAGAGIAAMRGDWNAFEAALSKTIIGGIAKELADIALEATGIAEKNRKIIEQAKEFAAWRDRQNARAEKRIAGRDEFWQATQEAENLASVAKLGTEKERQWRELYLEEQKARSEIELQRVTGGIAKDEEVYQKRIAALEAEFGAKASELSSKQAAAAAAAAKKEADEVQKIKDEQRKKDSVARQRVADADMEIAIRQAKLGGKTLEAELLQIEQRYRERIRDAQSAAETEQARMLRDLETQELGKTAGKSPDMAMRFASADILSDRYSGLAANMRASSPLQKPIEAAVVGLRAVTEAAKAVEKTLANLGGGVPGWTVGVN